MQTNGYEIDPLATTRIIGNCVDAEACAPPLVGDTPRLVFAGRLGKRKGIYDLMAALERLARKEVSSFMQTWRAMGRRTKSGALCSKASGCERASAFSAGSHLRPCES